MANVILGTTDGTWVNDAAVQYDAGELRRADAALFSAAGIASGLVVTVNASDNMTVTAGSWVISGESALSGSGVYRGGVAANLTGSLQARDATNGRIDLVVARQYDPDVVPAHTESTAKVEVITGTPAATPSAPALPSLAVELARITVPASGGGAASVDSSRRVYAAGRTAPAVAGELYATTQTITDNTTTNVTFGSVAADVPSGFADAANNRLVIPQSGRYIVDLMVEYAPNATGRREVSLLVNGSVVRYARHHSVSAINSVLNLTVSRWFAAGQLITATTLQTSGGNLATVGKRMSATFLGS